MRRKTVFLAVTHGWHARLLLRSSFLGTLAQNGNIAVVILSPSAKEKYFRGSFGQNFELCLIEPQSVRLFNRLNMIRRRLLLNSRSSESLKIITRAMRRYDLRRYWAVVILNRCLSRWPAASLLRTIDRILLPDRAYHDLFCSFKPDLLVLCSIVHNEAVHLLRRAKIEKVPTVFVVESWDNPTCKVAFFDYPEKYMVWNEIMRQELIEFHGINAEDIWVTGSAYHDVYAHPEKFCTREMLAKRYGLDPAARWIVIAATLENLYPEFDVFLERLETVRASDAFGSNCQILIRPHPQAIAGYSQGHGVKELEAVRKKFPCIFYDIPPVLSQRLPVDAGTEDILRLAEILHHADVMISFFSTVTIDACAVDTPVVLPAFDDYADKTWFPTMRERLRFNHHQNVVKTGGVKVAMTFDELVEHVQVYLRDPSTDRAGRRRIIKEQCHKLDGQSGHRMAECVIEYLSTLRN